MCKKDFGIRRRVLEKISHLNIPYKDEIAQYCESISKINPNCIILYGSLAREEAIKGSDIDLIVIAEFKLNFLDRIKLLIDLDSTNSPIEPLGYTKEEFENMLLRGNVTALDAVAEGICLDGIELFKKYRNIYEELLKKGLKKDKISWKMPEP